jgi:hypothetical protein
MRHIFIAHTPFLLEEFPCGKETVLKHNLRTPQRTKLLAATLNSLGKAVRLNHTLWLLSTDHLPSDVLNRLQQSLASLLNIEEAGDIFVIEASDFAATTSIDIAAQLQTICKVTPNLVSLEPKPVVVPKATKPYSGLKKPVKTNKKRKGRVWLIYTGGFETNRRRH